MKTARNEPRRDARDGFFHRAQLRAERSGAERGRRGGVGEARGRRESVKCFLRAIERPVKFTFSHV